MTLPVLIVGGGIGGLCTALALNNSGISSIVIEREEFEDRSGAGIQLSPNAMRLLFQLGIERGLVANASKVHDIVTRNGKSGRVLYRFPLGHTVEALCGFPYLQVLRSHLIDVLLKKIHDEPRIQLRPQSRVHSLNQSTESVEVATQSESFVGTLAIGADGVHSTMRSLMGKSHEPRFSGWIAWRTTVVGRIHSGADTSETSIWCDPRGHVVTYPTNDKGVLNCVFITKSPTPLADSWRQRGDLNELHMYFKDWHGEVTALLDSIEESRLFRWGLFRHRRISDGWTKGRCVLLGDACHSVLPFMAQGAALAIEDSFVLARCLERTMKNPEDSLLEYERLRVRRCARIQRRSELMGDVYHLRRPWSWFRDMGTGIAVNQLIRNVYNYDATANDHND